MQIEFLSFWTQLNANFHRQLQLHCSAQYPYQAERLELQLLVHPRTFCHLSALPVEATLHMAAANVPRNEKLLLPGEKGCPFPTFKKKTGGLGQARMSPPWQTFQHHGPEARGGHDLHVALVTGPTHLERRAQSFTQSSVLAWPFQPPDPSRSWTASPRSGIEVLGNDQATSVHRWFDHRIPWGPWPRPKWISWDLLAMTNVHVLEPPYP